MERRIGKSYSCGELIGFSSTKTFTVRKRPCDKNGRILILETLIGDPALIVINFYSVNTENEQIQTFNELNILLSKLGLSSDKHISIIRDFNSLLESSLNVKGGSPSLKKYIF